MATSLKKNEILLLFDVDGTLTEPRCVIDPEVERFLFDKIAPKASLGLVSGSNFAKVAEQMRGEDILNKVDYFFPENGLVYYRRSKLMSKQSLENHLGEENVQEIINFCLNYMSKLQLPRKRGTFIEFRTGMLNICPVGRSCTMEHRKEFHQFDMESNTRHKFTEALTKEFGTKLGMKFSIGGQISIDAFPIGWDKTFCLGHVEKDCLYKEIHFFGDKTHKGGNDHEIFEDPRTIGHAINSPEETVEELKKLFGL